MKNQMLNNIEFSEEWLLKEMFKVHDVERQSGQALYIKIKKIDLLKLVLKFINLNRRGDI